MEEMLKIRTQIANILKEIGVSEDIVISFATPDDPTHGDYTTNVSFAVAKELKKSPLSVAQEIEGKLQSLDSKIETIEKIEVVAPGFINFFLSKDFLISQMEQVIGDGEKIAAINNSSIYGKKIMVEYAHPNTHKELHIGHMRTLITGEALARIFTANGAEVFRANYQGDIGPHVAKALYGIQKIMQEKGLTIDEIEEWSDVDKAHFLGEGYIRGNVDYDKEKATIDALNTTLYTQKSGPEIDLYKRTRKWSLDYYDKFYARFYTKFNHLFFESQMISSALKIIKDNIGNVFLQDDDGSIIFPGEKYGLHRRVFITQAGNPTYEGKEICLGFEEYEAFHFDKKIHVVGSEQTGYFQVVFKALELLDPTIFKDKQYHLPMGMVQLKSGKMSSRTGEILRVDLLIDDVKNAVRKIFKDDKIPAQEKEKVLEQVTIGAIKYSVLKVGAKQDVAFDIEKSVSLDGDSGPYIQYTYARTQSILEKAKRKNMIPTSSVIPTELEKRVEGSVQQSLGERDSPQEYLLRGSGASTQQSFARNDNQLSPEELLLLRKIAHFNQVVKEAGETIAPNMICSFLYELAKQFNLFYQKHRIIDAQSESEAILRLKLTNVVGIILRQGLSLLGIEAPKRM